MIWEVESPLEPEPPRDSTRPSRPLSLQKTVRRARRRRWPCRVWLQPWGCGQGECVVTASPAPPPGQAVSQAPHGSTPTGVAPPTEVIGIPQGTAGLVPDRRSRESITVKRVVILLLAEGLAFTL